MSMENAAWHSLWRLSGDKGKAYAPTTPKRVLKFAAGYKTRLLIFVVFSICSAVLAVITPVLAGRIVDEIVAQSGIRIIINLALIIAAVAVLDAIVSVVVRWFSSKLGEGIIFDLRTAVFDHVQKMPVAFFARTRTGALVSRLNNDVIGAQAAFAGTLSGLVSNTVALILTAAVMFTTSWQVTAIALVLLPLFLLPARHFGRSVAMLRRESADLNAAMGNQMTERFSAPGATLIKLFGRPKDESHQFALRAGRVRDIGVKMTMRQYYFMATLTLVAALALALVYGLGGMYAVRGELAAGDVVVLGMLLTRLYAPLTALANARVEITSALVSFDRVFEVLDLEPLIKDAPNARRLEPGPVPVKFSHVNFSYPSADKVSLASLEEVAVLDTRGGQEVLHDIDFEVKAGQTVALVGSSGAGKSTIASLLARLYDVDSGTVELAGTDIRELKLDSLRETVSMVTQDGHLFHESIRSNLLLARPGAEDSQLWEALERARLKPVIAALPDGLDTVVGERGYRLSGGERQRMTIARLLLAAPQVVILDEATAALDSANEAAVQAALTEALENRTALIIAHRLSTIRSADQILVVEGGRIIERGTHSELLALGGKYTELYETQFAQ
ncbi:ABC transporter ATP-binding protein [Glutamicibacter protophormiae]|uniref:ABC-type multidrug transport system fused ATPase/permease subunit n=1 Tax=Glutamicibacter protophormiae TaxID=37930 RepID=A0ABS4XMV4_GLUPR|nr:ABC transporter ATP-binding protein [Glutamicibacter protophormiae]MBP2397856.1 ABC-type multidrug transport system fused ATPase/permease subunit [Glutamicibacter protophormiae]GGL86075.1 ABC transporter ATP-binding protein [Glutamicibacter protophormiae]